MLQSEYSNDEPWMAPHWLLEILQVCSTNLRSSKTMDGFRTLEMGGIEPPSEYTDQERLQVYRCEVVVERRCQHRKRRLRILENVLSKA